MAREVHPEAIDRINNAVSVAAKQRPAPDCRS